MVVSDLSYYLAANGVSNDLLKVLSKLEAFTGYTGTLEKLFEIIKDNLNGVNDREVNALYQFIPLITRFGINQSIKFKEEGAHDKSVKAYEFARKGIELLKRVLLNKDADKLFNELIKSRFYKECKGESVIEPRDEVSEFWSNPDKITPLLEHINERVPKKKLVILNFAHGSTRAAIILGLLLELSNFNVINIPLRFSIHKSHDKKFKFPTRESGNELIRLLESDYKVLIFDEDCSSGQTFSKANDYILNSALAKYKDNIIKGVIGLTNTYEQDSFSYVDLSSFKIYGIESEKEVWDVKRPGPILLFLLMTQLIEYNKANKKLLLVDVTSKSHELVDKIYFYLKSCDFKVELLSNPDRNRGRIKSLSLKGYKVILVSDEKDIKFNKLMNDYKNLISEIKGRPQVIDLDDYKLIDEGGAPFITWTTFEVDDDAFNITNFKAILRTLPEALKRRPSNKELIQVNYNIDLINDLIGDERKAYEVILRIRHDEPAFNKLKNKLSESGLKELIDKFIK